MIDLLKKVMFTGVGLAAMTKDKIEDLGKEMIKRGELSEHEGKAFVDEVMKRSEEAKKDFEDRVGEMVRNAVNSIQVATKTDIAALTAKIDRLEAQLASKTHH